jgi:hypothetical protein
MPVKMPLKLPAHREQHQPAQSIYITEVKRLSPVGKRENLKPVIYSELKRSRNPEVKFMETLIQRSWKRS